MLLADGRHELVIAVLLVLEEDILEVQLPVNGFDRLYFFIVIPAIVLLPSTESLHRCDQAAVTFLA